MYPFCIFYLNQNNMKQSSIEWFVEELNNWRIKHFGENSIIGIPNEVFNKAKEMHKHEIIEAYKEGSKEGVRYYINTEWGDDTKHVRGDEFYKNTYEKEN